MFQNTQQVTWMNHRNPRITQLVQKQKSRNDKSESFYLLVGDTGGEVCLEDSDCYEAERIYRRGACISFAYVVHLITHFPIAVFTAPNVDAENWSGHVTVQLPNGNFFDITGETTASEINRYYYFPADVTPNVFENSEDVHPMLSSYNQGNLDEDGVLGYMLTHLDELGFLVTLHFVEQLLSFYEVDFDETRLRDLESKVSSYARTQNNVQR